MYFLACIQVKQYKQKEEEWEAQVKVENQKEVRVIIFLQLVFDSELL